MNIFSYVKKTKFQNSNIKIEQTSYRYDEAKSMAVGEPDHNPETVLGLDWKKWVSLVENISGLM